MLVCPITSCQDNEHFEECGPGCDLDCHQSSCTGDGEAPACYCDTHMVGVVVNLYHITISNCPTRFCWMAVVNPSQNAECASTLKVVLRERATLGSLTLAPNVAAPMQLCHAPSLPAHHSHVDLAPRQKSWKTQRRDVVLVKFVFPQWASAPLQWLLTVESSNRQSR